MKTRDVVLSLVFFALGVAVSAVFFLNRKPAASVVTSVAQQSASPVAGESKMTPQSDPPRPPFAAAEPEPLDETVRDDLLKLFPKFESQSFDEMATTLRLNALEEFGNATVTMRETLDAAQKKLAANQSSLSEAERIEAVKEFQKLQQDQSAKLGEITARLQRRIATLERMKGVTR